LRFLDGSSTLGCVPISILIVDDDAVFRRAARELLTARGYGVAGEAATAAEARTAVKRQGPDGLLLDVNLPDGDGLALAAELCAARPAMRILLTSNNETAGPPDVVKQTGAAGFVAKRALVSANIAAYFGGSTD
jgi:DNA-binding NarL/FixJ family response regulator